MSENESTAPATPAGAGRSRRDAPLEPTESPTPGAAEPSQPADPSGADSDGRPADDGAGTGVAGLAAPEDEPRSDEESRRARRSEQRRGRTLWFVIGVPVVLVAAVVLFFVLRPADSDPAATATVTTTLPVPTASSEPLDRADATALVQALPGTVRQFVLATVEPTDALEGAVEGWTVVYEGEALSSDGSSASAVSTGSADATDSGFTVTVGQWADAERATEAAAGLSADLGEPTSTEDVTVGDEVTGTLSFYGADGASEGTAVWTNGTVVLRAVGPASEVVNFATGFGL